MLFVITIILIAQNYRKKSYKCPLIGFTYPQTYSIMSGLRHVHILFRKAVYDCDVFFTIFLQMYGLLISTMRSKKVLTSMFFIAVLMAFLSRPAFAADPTDTPVPTNPPATNTPAPTSSTVTTTPAPSIGVTTTPNPTTIPTVIPTNIPVTLTPLPTITSILLTPTPTPSGTSVTPTPTSSSGNGNSSPSPSPTGVVQAASVSTTPTPQPIAKAVASTLNDVSNALYSDVIKFPTSFFSHPEQQYYKNSSLSKKITISLLVISAMLFIVGVLLLLPERIFWKRIKIQIIREKVKTWRYALASLL